MSSGPFLDAFYELGSGLIAGIRIQPETAALVLDGSTNTIPAGPATVPVKAKVSGTRRSYGINARGVYIKFTTVPATGQYNTRDTIFLPWLQADTWEALNPNATGNYLGGAVKLVGKRPEYIK